MTTGPESIDATLRQCLTNAVAGLERAREKAVAGRAELDRIVAANPAHFVNLPSGGQYSVRMGRGPFRPETEAERAAAIEWPPADDGELMRSLEVWLAAPIEVPEVLRTLLRDTAAALRRSLFREAQLRAELARREGTREQ